MRRFRYGFDPLCLLGCGAYAANRWLLRSRLHAGFWHNHFNDLWLIPCALPLVLWLHRRLGWRQDGPPTTAETLGHLMLWSLICEAIGPSFWTGATGDGWDVVCYSVGGVVAWVWWNRACLRPSRSIASP